MTYPEVIGVLTEYDWQEQDRRNWQWAMTLQDPIETYNEMRRAIEDAMAPPEPIVPELEDWFKAR